MCVCVTMKGLIKMYQFDEWVSALLEDVEVHQMGSTCVKINGLLCNEKSNFIFNRLISFE